mgnify:CR=1 FL=1
MVGLGPGGREEPVRAPEIEKEGPHHDFAMVDRKAFAMALQLDIKPVAEYIFQREKFFFWTSARLEMVSPARL